MVSTFSARIRTRAFFKVWTMVGIICFLLPRRSTFTILQAGKNAVWGEPNMKSSKARR